MRKQTEVFVCRKCGTKNPLAKNAFQSVSCFDCGTKHAIVTDGQKKIFAPYWQQERPRSQGAAENTEE